LKEQFHGEGKNKVINFTSYIHNHKSVPKKLKNTAGNALRVCASVTRQGSSPASGKLLSGIL
jgi:hypothetical protein